MSHITQVKVVKANHLNKKDLITQNDVYIDLWIDSHLLGRQHTTRVSGSDPVFNQSFKFEHNEHELHLDVRDKDLVGSDGIGKAKIPLGDLPIGKPVVKEVDLYAGLVDFTSNGKQCDPPAAFGISDVRTLILLLQSPDQVVCLQALDSLIKFGQKGSKYRVQLLNSNILKPLLNLTSSKDMAIKKATVACIAASTEIAEIHAEMRRKELFETLVSLLAAEEPPEVQDEAAFAISNLAKDFKTRNKIKAQEAIGGVLRLLTLEDCQTLVNACDCIANLAETVSPYRIDAVKLGGVSLLLSALNKADTSVQSSACLALARCMQEGEARLSLAKEKKNESIARLIALVLSKEVTVARNAAYALSNASQHDLAAKYWLRNELSAANIIKGGFYGIGSAGANLDTIKSLASLSQLSETPADKRRDVLLRQIAAIVSNVMGEPVETGALSEFAFKFKKTELKMKAGSNVIPIDQVYMGTFYHRASLLKAIWDKIGLGPCQLIRGDYGTLQAKTVVTGSRKLGSFSQKLPSVSGDASWFQRHFVCSRRSCKHCCCIAIEWVPSF
ncbi:armadillo-type protein [Chytriomyces cf. hyalinus JEL632]|nr:armadillo-type protein [Chytriomyces cf. hyalinus JEL632]